MRIIHVITGLDTGGAESSLHRLLSRIAPHFEPHVISLSTMGGTGYEIRRLGIPVESLGMKPGIPEPLTLVRLTRRLMALKPNVVHTWMYHADLVGGIAAHLARVPAVAWSIRNSDLSINKTKWTTRMVVRACALLSRRIPDRIVSCSSAARDIHIALGYDETRFIVIPNGFDLNRFRPDPVAFSQVRDELNIPVNTFVIGLVARFDPLKNHEGFFEAAGILHAKRPDVHFVLAGKGIEITNPRVAAWVRKMNIEGVTHLLGLREDIPRLTAAFDLATSSSWGEAFSNTVGEAMACAVPCVVTDVGDSAYTVGDTGLTVAPGDICGLAVAWEKLLGLSGEERRALGARARARVAENFSLETVVRRYEEFYEQLVRTKA